MGNRAVGADADQSGARSDAAARFPGPLQVPTPPGADGWSDMYPYSLPFGEARREYDESVFWFREAIHWPRPLRPFEAAVVQYALTSLGQFNHRHYLAPCAKGFDFRILNGFLYLSPGTIDDPDRIAERTAQFRERGGYYYEHWDELYAGWMVRVRALLARLDAVSFPALVDAVPVDDVVSGRGLGPSYDLSRRYHDVLDLAVELWQYHFEFLNLGYGAYLDYFGFCRAQLPDIDDLVIARMVAGIDVDLFRPDQELRRLARAAVAAGLAEVLCDGPVEDCLTAIAGVPGGGEWFADFERTQDPWFNYSTGGGFYHDDVVWADRLDVPLAFIRGYIAQLLAGQCIDTPGEDIAAERDRLADETRARLDPSSRDEFEAKLRLARTVFHFVENHNFYVEHWGMSLVWRKLRGLSAVFVKDGFWNAVDDIFFLRTDEIDAALWDMLAAWANESPALGPHRWPAEIERRKAILEACAGSGPPPALGIPPAIVNDPFTTMLWGVTSESIDGWLAGPAGDVVGAALRGMAVSPGVIIGRARVVCSPDALDEVEDGEILVAENTLPSWAPVFARIAGTVTEVGGMMSHAAIVCREYGLPAVTGVTRATQLIRTGQRLQLDGGTGLVSILD